MKVTLAALAAQLGACAEISVRPEEGPTACYRTPCTHTVQQGAYVACQHYSYVWVYCCCHLEGGHMAIQPLHTCDAVTTCVPLHPNGHWVCFCGMCRDIP